MFGLQSKRLTDVTQGFTFTRRAMVLGGVQAGIGLLLAGRMGYIAIAEGDLYSTLADSNRINLTLIPPRRGWIVDRHGQPIANNRTDFRVDIIPSRLTDKEATLARLTELLALEPDDLARINEELKVSRGFQPVQVAADLDWQRYAAVSVRLPEMPGVAPARGFTRNYPDGAAVAHLIGYVGAASAEQYEKTRNPLYLTPGFKVGKDNLEKTLEARLAGKPGAKRVEVTARGKLVRELTTRPDTPGETIRLTVDAGLQRFAARRLGDNSGSVVVIDLLTGGILTMASMPAYDPNSFSDGIGHDEWDMLSNDDHLPLLNKAMQGLYPPGSTFKPASALALLGAGVDPEERVYCNGGYQLGNRRFGCLGRHGPMNLHTAIARSCNTYFYHMGRRVGIDAIADAARKLGLGAEYPLPLPSQRYGTVPDPAWKRRRYDQAWAQSDTLNTSIGQGYLLVNPVQLAVMASRVASGRALVPNLLMGREKPAPPLPFPAEHLAAVRAGMDEVVNGHGTAGRSRLPLEGIRLGGKTGTAQVRRISGGARGGLGVPWKYRDHGLFVCFAPVDNPRYAASVVIEHGMSGSGAAAPVASDTLLYLFDREKALAKLETLEAGWGGGIEERMARQAAAFKAMKAGAGLPPAPPAEAASTVANATTPTPAPILDRANNTVAPVVVPGE
ncbi:penicillin-binding protein 2 [Sphingomonas gilva]|uniref:Penicillin-binding protein 2 n=1 Tax=Sphingomonas gilva TaxID=2305907 RepID=A0A396RZD6_9SPHN|nr:penicillin-binding protein 2 [Sphingomonas gilva]RHW16465.1 penicillin-binding protein 2 [Sphingomonas gilva]